MNRKGACLKKLLADLLLYSLVGFVWSVECLELEEKNLICYYDGLNVASRPAAGQLNLDNIDASLCSHIIYRHVRFNEENEVFLETEGVSGSLSKLALLKQLNPSLKTLVSVTEESSSFSRMAGSGDSRATFVRSVSEFLDSHSLEGVEIVWKYPNDWAGQPSDKANFVSLLSELRAALSARGQLLAVAAPVGDRRVRAGFDVEQVARETDLINLMSFDYNGAWDNETGLHAPLYQAAEGEGSLSVNWSVNLWLSLGAPAHKLQVGVTAYVRTFNLRDKNENGLRRPTSGFAKPGPFTKDPKLLAYNEWCELYQRSSKQWRLVRDVAGSRASYAHNGLLWVSLEDPESAAHKAQYVALMGLGGALVNSLDMDDFGGRCGGARFPIASALKAGLAAQLTPPPPPPPVNNRPTEANRNTDAPSFIEEAEYPRRPTSAPKPPPIKPAPTPAEQEQPATRPPPILRPPPPAPDRQQPQPQQPPVAVASQQPTCGANGNWYFPGPTCRQYYDCTETGAPVLKVCRDNLIWKQSKLWCDFQENVPECIAS